MKLLARCLLTSIGARTGDQSYTKDKVYVVKRVDHGHNTVRTELDDKGSTTNGYNADNFVLFYSKLWEMFFL